MAPVEIARAYATLANGGIRPEIRTFEDVVDHEAHTLERQAVRFERVLDAGTAYLVTSLLEGVVERGTGQGVRASGITGPVAGKTGTVRIHEAGGGYSTTRYRAFFAGMAPASNPRFVAVVLINDPRGAEYYGGDVAAPVFAAVVGKALRMYGVAPDALPEQGSMLISRAAVE